VPVPKEAGREFHWVRPQLIAKVRYGGWTSDNILRHPTFEALRDDTIPTDVVRETPADSASPQEPREKPATRGRNRKSTGSTMPKKMLDDLAQVRLTTPQKVMYPDVGLTKLDLIRYYVEIADWILSVFAALPNVSR
jgi:bifunctional non-homologous end joining protein LigD